MVGSFSAKRKDSTKPGQLQSLQVILLCLGSFYFGAFEGGQETLVFIIAALISSTIPMEIIANERLAGTMWLLISLPMTRLELATIKWLNSFILGYGASSASLLALGFLGVVAPEHILRWIVLGFLIVGPTTLVVTGLALLFRKETVSWMMLGVFFAYFGLVNWLGADTEFWIKPLWQTGAFIGGNGIAALAFAASVRAWSLRSVPT